jgi:hypothetical protein
LVAIAALLGLSSALAEDKPSLVLKPLSIASVWEFGQLQSTKFTMVAQPYRDVWIDHLGAFVSQEAIVDERLHLAVGLGGIFQFPKPEVVNPVFGGSQNKAFYIGPARASADYHFGDIDNPSFKLGLGLFNYKYNPDAANLGEYLFRTGTYPTWIMTGGYLVANSASSFLQGFKAETHAGPVKLDLLATTETKLAPLFDWSFSAIASYNMGRVLDLGLGLTLANYLSVDKKKTTVPQDIQAREIANAAGRASILNPDTNATFTFKGEKVMARAAFNPLAFFDTDLFGPDEGKFYAELTVVGWKNYPMFFEKRMERTPIMFGFNVPTAKLLDRVAVEFEYLNSPWINSTYNIGNSPGMPLPRIPDDTEEYYIGIADKDNFRWSVYARKSLFRNLTAHALVARDHLRLVSREFYYGPSLEPDELTMKPENWYWMVQFSFGI